MAFHLKADERVPAAIRRIAREELDSAVIQLEGKDGASRDEAIHEARKSVKKTRATLRLVAKELGNAFRLENVRLRDIGRTLSGFRDAGAILETLDELGKHYPAKLGGSVLDPVRSALITRKQEAERTAGMEQVIRSLLGKLRRTAKRADGWPLKADGFAAIASGLQKTFTQGRRALALATEDARPEHFHEWRKRVKDHWYHIRLLEPLWPELLEAYAGNLKELETWLGEDHNLVVLREKVQAEPDFYAPRQTVANLLEFIGLFQKELRENSVSLGQRIYSEKPGQFRKRMEGLWDAWEQGRDGAGHKLDKPVEPVTSGRRSRRAAAKPATAA